MCSEKRKPLKNLASINLLKNSPIPLGQVARLVKYLGLRSELLRL